MPPLGDHPVLTGLRALREPRGRTLAVVEALCRRREMPDEPDPDWRRRLPTDEEIARELRMTVSSVRTHIRDVANWIEGLEELEARPRIYLWYWHRQWERGAVRRTA